MLGIVRDAVYQPFDTYTFSVQVTPTRLSDTISVTKADLIDSFVISVPATAANNVFIGGTNVTTTSGIEIVAGGGPINFVIENQREHYELLEPIIVIAEALQCSPEAPRSLPFIIWDFSQIYLIATAITTVSVAPFRSMFI